MKRKIISILLILIGLFLIAYPKASELYADYRQQRLTLEWKESLSNIDTGNIDPEDDNGDIGKEQQDIRQDSNVNNSTKGEQSKNNSTQGVEEGKRLRDKYVRKNMEGMLRIKKINLYLPILTGATEKKLKISVSSIEHTGKAGQIGNYAIAGHRNYGYGRNFNRLDEVEAGDIIEVESGKKQYKYVVVEKLYVKPEDTWVLEGNRQRKEITLVTCHPMVKPTHRLIIKGKILD